MNCKSRSFLLRLSSISYLCGKFATRNHFNIRWNTISSSLNRNGRQPGRPTRPIKSRKTQANPNITCSTCFHTRRALACTSVIRWDTSLPISIPVTKDFRVTTYYTQWDTMPMAYQLNNMPSSSVGLLKHLVFHNTGQRPEFTATLLE